MIKGIEIKSIQKEIIITKKFEKAAAEVGSDSYKALRDAIKDFPDFSVKYKEIKKKEGKTTYKGLNYNLMEEFLNKQENSEKLFEMYEKVKALSKQNGKGYAFVKTWFLKTFEDFSMENIEMICA